MTCIRRILLPTDFSALAGRAAALAGSLAVALRAELHVLHVHQPPPAPTLDAPGSGFSPPLLARPEDLRPALDAFVATHLASTAAEIIKEVVVGAVSREIIDYSHRHSIDLIVIGTHARGVVKRILLGSTSKTVLEHAGCAVLMVPLSAAFPEASELDGALTPQGQHGPTMNT